MKDLLKSHGFSTNVGDEGGFAPNLKSNEHAIELILSSIEKAGYKVGSDVSIALDAAASEFYNKDNATYYLNNSSQLPLKLDSSKMVDFGLIWLKDIQLLIEDALHEDDWNGWSNLTNKIGNKIQLVGDDLFVTNTKRLQLGIENSR